MIDTAPYKTKKYFLINAFSNEEHVGAVLDDDTYTGAIAFALSGVEFEYYKLCASKLAEIDTVIPKEIMTTEFNSIHEDPVTTITPPVIILYGLYSSNEYPFVKIMSSNDIPDFLLSERDLITILKDRGGFIELSKEEFESIPNPEENIDIRIEISNDSFGILAETSDDEFHTSSVSLLHLQELHFINTSSNIPNK